MNKSKLWGLAENTSKLTKLLNDYIAPFSDVVSNEDCREHSFEYTSELREGTSWAWQMFDSSAKIQTGILTGNINSLGDFDECIDVKNTTGKFIGQYCLATFKLSNITHDFNVVNQIMNEDTSVHEGLKRMLMRGMRWGFCIPSSCTANDLVTDLAHHIKPLGGFEVSVSESGCSSYDEVNYSALDWVTIWVFIVLLLLVIMSTGYEISTETLKEIRSQRFLTRTALKESDSLPEVKECDEEEVSESVPYESEDVEGIHLVSPPSSRPSSSLSFHRRFPGKISHDRKYTITFFSNPNLPTRPESRAEDPIKEQRIQPKFLKGLSGTESVELKSSLNDVSSVQFEDETEQIRDTDFEFNEKEFSAEPVSDSVIEDFTRDMEPYSVDTTKEEKSQNFSQSNLADIENVDKQKHVDESNEHSVVEETSPRSSNDLIVDPIYRGPNWLCSFSLFSNGRHIFHVNKGKSKLSSLYGLKFLSMLWLLFGHTMIIMDSIPSVNHLTFKHRNREWYYMLIQNSPLAIDVFLVVTGVLLSFNFLKDLTVTKIHDYMEYPVRKIWKLFSCYLSMYYLHRFMRLTPALAVMVLFQSSLIWHFGSGPFWNRDTQIMMEACREYWWSALMYVQNYVNGDRMCLVHSWYLMVEMQLYLFSPLILLALWFWPLITNFLFMLSLLIVAIITSFFVNYILEFPAGHTNANTGKWEEKMQYEYIVTHARFGPWIVGLFVGYMLFKFTPTHTRRPGHRMDAYPRWLWLLAAMGLFYSVFGAITFQSPHHENTIGRASVYNCLFRNVWAMSIGWIIFACETNNGGFIQMLLAWKAFQPLGRLTYCIYLVHMPLMIAKALTIRVPIQKSDLVTVSSVCSDIMLSTLIALILVLCVELPFVRLYEAIRCQWFYRLQQWIPPDTHLQEESKDQRVFYERNMDPTFEDNEDDNLHR